jgi:MFS family permease
LQLAELLLVRFFNTLAIATAMFQARERCVLMKIAAGVGVGGSVPGVFTLVAEYMPRARRGFYISVVAWFWMVS